jgi:lysyl endopeptidase
MAQQTSRMNGWMTKMIRMVVTATVLGGTAVLEPVALGSEGDDTIVSPVDLPSWFFERRIIGDNNLEKIEAAKSSEYYQMAKPVAIVKDTSDQGFCTGWRVAEDLFMTNYHCWEFSACNVTFELDYETALDGQKHARFKCEEVLAKNETYDYALYRVSRESDDGDSKPTTGRRNKKSESALADEGGVVTMSGAKIKVGQLLIVSGHPQARTKEIDRSNNCKISTVEPEEIGGRQTIRHTCDTEGGSSGSPVLDRKTGHAVALHWGGESGYNMAIPMDLVLDDLEKQVDAKVFKKLTVVGRR